MNDLDTSGVDLWLALRRAASALEIRAVKSIAGQDMCPSDFSVLGVLLQRGPLPVNTLGKEMLLTSGSITIAIDRLQKRRLVERQWQKEDRRVCLVALTAEGEKLVSAAFQNHAIEMRDAFAGFSSTEQENLLSLLEKLTPATTEKAKLGDASTSKSRKEKEKKKAAAPESEPPRENPEAGFSGFAGLD